MAFNPFEDLRVFAVNRPPLIVFVICLCLFGIVLMSLAFYVNDPATQLSNPDVKDWNMFLRNFADLEFCILGDEHNETVSTVASPTTVGNRELTTQSDLNYQNYSVSMLLTVSPTRDFVSIPHNVTFLTGSIPALHVGIKGAPAEELINVSMRLPNDWNSTKCHKNGCDTVDIYTCVFFHGPASVFPETVSPETCERVNDTGVEYHARFVSQPPKNMFTPYYCKNRPLIKARYQLNTKLTMWLTMQEYSTINLHLMHTSYFLFVMVVLILVFALFKGRSISYSHGDKIQSSSIASSAAI